MDGSDWIKVRYDFERVQAVKIVQKSAVRFWKIKNTSIFAPVIAEVAQLVEHNLAKVRVAGSSPVFRSNR